MFHFWVNKKTQQQGNKSTSRESNQQLCFPGSQDIPSDVVDVVCDLGLNGWVMGSLGWNIIYLNKIVGNFNWGNPQL